MFFLHLYEQDSKRRKKVMGFFCCLFFLLSLCSGGDLLQLSGASQAKNSSHVENGYYIDTSMVMENI